MMVHNRAYGVDVEGSRRLSAAVWRLASEGALDSVINYKANTYGGLQARQDLAKGTHLVVLKPSGNIQTVFLFTRISKGEHIEVECNGPPSHVETTKAVCSSFKTTK